MLERIAQAVEGSPVKSPVKSLYNFTEKAPVATPSKEELGRKWLADHPEDKGKTSRWLAENVKPMGVTISHVTWNKLKKEG